MKNTKGVGMDFEKVKKVTKKISSWIGIVLFAILILVFVVASVWFDKVRFVYVQ
jgi:uncharacterized integral membrane protein